jgi:hypothetical protein
VSRRVGDGVQKRGIQWMEGVGYVASMLSLMRPVHLQEKLMKKGETHMTRKFVLATLMVFGVAATSGAYPNGTPHYVTDLVPACASCHSVLDPATMPEMPPDMADMELASNKHIVAIQRGLFPMYSELTSEQKASLIEKVQALDREASVELIVPTRVNRGEEFEAMVKYTGGNGPVVGVMLLDRALRYQARPVQAKGWSIISATAQTSTGGDASEWFARRLDKGEGNLNFILIPANRSAGGPAPSGTAAFRLKAPRDPGDYSMAVAFLYGTENTDRAGFFQRPSGRVRFSKELTVSVK